MVIKKSKMVLFNIFFFMMIPHDYVQVLIFFLLVKILSWVLNYRHKNSRFFSAKLVKNIDLQFLYKLMATVRL